MVHVFYIFAVVAIIWEAMCVYDTKVAHTKLTAFRKLKREDKWTSAQGAFAVFNVVYFAWTIVGLLSSQWVLFAALLAISFIPRKNIVMFWINAAISLMLLVFMLVNKYHLHINLFNLIF